MVRWKNIIFHLINVIFVMIYFLIIVTFNHLIYLYLFFFFIWLVIDIMKKKIIITNNNENVDIFFGWIWTGTPFERRVSLFYYHHQTSGIDPGALILSPFYFVHLSLPCASSNNASSYICILLSSTLWTFKIL